MKAEQRKELETNALADRMGHLVQRMKTQPRRTATYWVLGGVVVFVVVFFAVRSFQLGRTESSHNWVVIDMGSRLAMTQEYPGTDALMQASAESNQGKTARFQRAWIIYWEAGVKLLGVDPDGAIKALEESRSNYAKLAEDCADDPYWEQEAMYALAVIDETLAVQNRDSLDRARDRYEELAKKHEKSARGQLAKDWLANYEKADKQRDLKDFYKEMQTAFKIREDFLGTKQGLDKLKGFPKEPTKKSK
jgi:hypothetical protein